MNVYLLCKILEVDAELFVPYSCLVVHFGENDYLFLANKLYESG